MKILFITLSNIGDVILTFPVFDALHERFPHAKISVVLGPKARPLMEGNPCLDRLYVFEKRSTLKEKWRWLKNLRREKFDLVVDLRNTMMPYLVRGRKATRPAFSFRKGGHKKDGHFNRLKQIVKDVLPAKGRYALYDDKEDRLGAQAHLLGIKDYIVVAPGAADGRKRWPQDRFAKVITYLVKTYHAHIVVVGDKKDGHAAEMMFRKIPAGVIDTCGVTTLRELAVILKGAKLALLNDSGIMHLASYFNIPVIALFGPTDPLHYGPWSDRSLAIRRGKSTDNISVEDICSALDTFLSHEKSPGYEYPRKP
jgi:ADP-heptose:LPS heptosyltransferase